MNRMTRTLGILVAVAAIAFSTDAYAQAPAPNDAEVGMGAITACMDKGKDGQAQSTCVLGVAITVMAARAPTAAAAAPPQILVQQPAPRSGLGVIGDILAGFLGPIKDTAIALAPAAAQVYSARTNAHTQEVIAGFNRDSTIASYGAFTNLGSSIERAGTAGYPYVQAPGAVTTNTLSGTGVLGAGQYTGPVSTTTTTTRTCSTGAAGAGGGTTTGAAGGASGGASC